MRGINHAEDFGWTIAPRFGGGGGGGTTTATSNTVTTPWTGQQPYLSGIQGDTAGPYPGIFPTAAQDYLYAKPQYFPGNTYQGLLPAQQAAATGIYNTGMAGGTVPLQSAARANAGITDPSYTGATSSTFGQANPSIGYLASGAYTNSTNPVFSQAQNYLSNTLGGAGVAPTAMAAGQNQGLLSNEIGGAYLDPSNDPGFQNVVNTTLANVMPQITGQFAGAGRSDSGLASRAAAQGATDAIGGLTLQNYLTERQNQNAAGQQAFQNLLAQQGLQQGAAGQAAQNQATGLGATETAQALASQNLLAQQGNQIKGVALAPNIDQTQMQDYNAALQAAGLNQQDLQNQINAQVQQWNYNQMLPWNTLGLYNSMIQGNFGSGVQGSTTQPYYTNPTANAISGIAGGLGAASSLATLISLLPSSGAAAGGGGAAAAALLGGIAAA